MYTISKIANRFGLSRSALLYYDTIGILSPSGRTRSNYRVYAEPDLERLQKICMYRNAGIPLKKIKQILDTSSSNTATILEERLHTLNTEINQLRQQQTVILKLLETAALQKSARTLDKKTWVRILSATGLSEADMDRWHREFEAKAPEAHQDFLESLGLTPAEIQTIRRASETPADT